MTFNRFCDIENIPDEQTLYGQNLQFTGCGSLHKPGVGLTEIYKIKDVVEEISVQAITLKWFCDNHDIHPTALIDRFEQVNARFENLVNVNETGRIIRHEARPLTRMIAREFDTYSLSDTGHSYAT
ncbi:MAG: hypothetical protein EBZ23_07995 [Rhodobacteraceae bacterium]|nr:hypothetical protein [Paracoccaceae bacterium]